MSDYVKGRIVNNIVELTGNKEDVDEAVMALLNDEGYVDFSKLVPVDKDEDDIQMDDYYNAALNVWLEKDKEIDRQDYISSMEFVGLTRERVYTFTELTDTQINVFKTKYKVGKMLNDANKFIDCVKKKSIFNGFFAREGAWGTGTQPIKQVIKGNRIEFLTLNTPALKVFKALAMKFPNIKIYYTYVYENENASKNLRKEYNQVTYKNREEKVIKQESKDEINTFKLIKDNVTM